MKKQKWIGICLSVLLIAGAATLTAPTMGWAWVIPLSPFIIAFATTDFGDV